MTQGQLSPDGRWLAYTALETGGQLEVYVRPFPSDPGRWKIPVSGTGNAEPRWSRQGEELFYLEYGIPRNRLMTAPVRSGSHGEFQAGTPKPLFEFAGRVVVPQANVFVYSSSPDGRRFLVMARISDAPPSLNIISNWERAALGMKP